VDALAAENIAGRANVKTSATGRFWEAVLNFKFYSNEASLLACACLRLTSIATSFAGRHDRGRETP